MRYKWHADCADYLAYTHTSFPQSPSQAHFGSKPGAEAVPSNQEQLTNTAAASRYSEENKTPSQRSLPVTQAEEDPKQR